MQKKKVVCSNCGSDAWAKHWDSEEDSSCNSDKGTYAFEFQCPKCEKISKAVFSLDKIVLLKKREL
jgi:hypothetical protein